MGGAAKRQNWFDVFPVAAHLEVICGDCYRKGQEMLQLSASKKPVQVRRKKALYAAKTFDNFRDVLVRQWNLFKSTYALGWAR